MPIIVRELLELPHLALELVAGSGGAHRAIQWAHVSEVEDPTPWLEGGELLLTTGLGLPNDAGGQVAYLERLARARAVGAVVVSDSAPPLTSELAAVADRLAFPLITTLLKQPFQAISKVVFAANSSVEVDRVVRHLRIYGVLRDAAAQGAGADEILARLSGLTGMRLAVVREDGRPQFAPGAPHPRWEEARGALEALGAGARRGLYARLETDERRPAAFVIQVEAAAPSRVFLIAEGLSPAAVPDLVAAHHIATIAATQVLAQRAERAVRQRLGADLLREIVGEGLSGKAARARLRALGFPGGPLTAIVLRPRPDPIEALYHGLLDHDVPALVGVHGDDVVLLAAVSGAPEDLAEKVAALASGGVIGVGTAVSLGEAQTSYREALVAAAYAESSGRPVATFEGLEAPLAWLPPEPERLALLIERTVGPLIAYDQERSTDLLLTLRAFLRSNRRPTLTAKVLHVHRNTLAYRLRRIEKLTGRSLDSMEDQVELWLGVRAYELAAGA